MHVTLIASEHQGRGEQDRMFLTFHGLDRRATFLRPYKAVMNI
jgi:hypothetical protein